MNCGTTMGTTKPRTEKKRQSVTKSGSLEDRYAGSSGRAIRTIGSTKQGMYNALDTRSYTVLLVSIAGGELVSDIAHYPYGRRTKEGS